VALANGVSGAPRSQRHERNGASDFEKKTQDDVAPAR
jgi:hypothetical protein